MDNKQNQDYTGKSRNYIKVAAILLVLLLIILAVLVAIQHKDIFGNGNIDVSSGTLDSSGEYYNNKNSGDNDMDDTGDLTANTPLIKINTDPTSYTVLVNKEYPMPEDYVPEDLTIPDVLYSYSGIYEKSYMRSIAARAIEEMFAEAKKKKKFELKVVSAYRSYARQKAIYENNINTRGEEKTKMVSAKPGCSEHQTGLAIDVSSDTVDCTIEESFASCPEGKWLAKNCQKFGFIIRYPKGKSDVTGYSYEPWHLRYVGVNLAKYIYKKNLTLEEYYKTTTIDDKIPEDEFIRDTDTNAPKEAEMTTAPTPQTTAYVSKTPVPAPIPEPSDTPVPIQTQKPVQTQKPKETQEPEKTQKPKVSKKPTRTQEPKKTQKPDKTAQPDKTQEPENTQEPEVTLEPENTQEPESTQEPEKIQEPVDTQAPENTQTPEEEPVESEETPLPNAE